MIGHPVFKDRLNNNSGQEMISQPLRLQRTDKSVFRMMLCGRELVVQGRDERNHKISQTQTLSRKDIDSYSLDELSGMLTDKLEVDKRMESALQKLILRTLNGDGSHSTPVYVFCDQSI